MAVFGRLDVLYPDGQRESHRLAGDVVTVGSAPDNTIRLDDETVAPRHLQIDALADGASITDLGSAAGTIIAGQRLDAHSPRPLRAVEEIRAGALRLRYFQRSDNPTVAMPALDEQTQQTGIDFRASLERSEYAVFPASSAAVMLEVTNLGRAEAAFRVETSGLPEGWVQPARFPFQLPAHETIQLQFQIKPALRSDMPPGEYPLTIAITGLGDAAQVLRLAAIIRLGGYSGLSLALAPAICQEDEPFRLFLLNPGNQSLELALSIRDPQGRLAADLTQERVELPPGGRRRISGKLRPRRRPLIGKAVEIPYALVASARNASAFTVAAPARLRVQPRWRYRHAALFALFLIAILLGASAVLIRPRKPEIVSFELSHSLVARGTPVQLNWMAANAERYVFEVNRARLAELLGDRRSYTLSTEDFAGPIDIALIALQGDATDISTLRLDIYEPVVIADFAANKTVMLRRVTDTLIVRWDVSGAVALELTRPLEFETIRKSAATAGRGEIELRGAPEADFEIRLAAEDEIGAIVESSIKIAVKAPECLPLQDALLYAGPDAGFQQIRLAVENVPVLARGAGEDGSWLLVELASGRTGWGVRSQFECRGFDIGALAVITDPSLLPTASAPPTPSAVPATTATAKVSAEESAPTGANQARPVTSG